MLNMLRKIIQEVNSAKDLRATLDIIVQRVKETTSIQICSVHLLDIETQRFVPTVTKSLSERPIGKVSIVPSEGLTGLVDIRGEPLNLENTVAHPCYRYFAETGEERYVSFLGVSIIRHRWAMGALVAQQKERRQFDEGEEASLVTMSAQLARAIAHTGATGSVRGLGKLGKDIQETRLVGVPDASGVRTGKIVMVLPPADLEVMPNKQVDDIDAEVTLFRQVLGGVRADIRVLSSKLTSQLRKEERVLLDAYLMMLGDASTGNKVKRIVRTGQQAQGTLRQAVIEHVQCFELMDDAHLREHASDVKDTGCCLPAYLQEECKQSLTYPEQTTIANEELSPAMLGEVPEGRLAGPVLVPGLGNSHVVIFVHVMGIPTMTGTVDLPYSKVDGIDLIIDGYHGEAYTNPPAELVRQCGGVVAEECELSKGLVALCELSYETLDGHRMSLRVNIDLPADIVRTQERGAEGVDLYRIEVPLMISDRFPSGKKQLAIYREQLSTLHLLLVTIHTLDVGGDKALSYFPIKEGSLFLGWRSIRVTLDHPEVFLVQACTIPKASEGLDNLRTLPPMISGTHELEETLYPIYRTWGEMRDESVDVATPPISMTVEIPAAVYQTRELVCQVDFFSVGSNDLTQHLPAVDRNNPRVVDLYDYPHPVVLHALEKVVDNAHLEGKPVSICGETVDDPVTAVLLMAMGLDNLSMNATNLPKVKRSLYQITLDKARDLFGQLFIFNNPQIIHSSLHPALCNLGPSRVINSAATVQP